MAVEPGGMDAADRGIPSLNARKGGIPPAIKGIVAVGVVVLAVGVGAVVFLNKLKADRQASESATTTDAVVESKLPPLDAAVFAERPELPEEAVEPAGPGAPGPAQPAISAPPTPEQQAAADLRERRQRAPLIAFNGGQAGGVGSAPAAAVEPGFQWPPMTTTEPAEPAGATLTASLEAVAVPGASAQVLRDPNLTITQAQILQCALNTAINSQVPGFVSCTLTSDVYSTNGRVVLLERGSRVVGQYESAQLKQGMSRIFVLWTRVETPKGVVIALDSPATDALGQAGVGGKINRHFWQRFGAGLLLSLVDDVAAAAVDNGGGQDVQFSSTSQSMSDAASIALESSVGIPPTLSKAQGGLVNVFVARDLYFGSVYDVRPLASR
ncbi:MAG: hypothetical protein A2X76_01405 [Lysobacterales bacterium GWF1_69_6]|nr:MAG: hypothetical protein A2X76_01405 [Xanthomonadales bacterium GWF1_69_6]